MTQPLLSVVIPTHNSSRYVAETVESVLAQSVADLELIIVDDGSSDDTVDVIRGLVARDARVRLLEQRQQGLGVARNAGLALARGRFFTIVDADDLWTPTKMERQIAALEAAPPLTISLTGVRRFYTDGVGGMLWSSETSPPRLSPGAGKMKQLISLTRNQMVVFNTSVFRREDIVSLGGWNTEVSTAHDWELWLRAGRSFEFHCLDEPLMLYRKHSTSMTRMGDADGVLATHEALITRELQLHTVSKSVAKSAVAERRLDRVMDLRHQNQLVAALRRWLSLGADPDCLRRRRLWSEGADIARAWLARGRREAK